MRAVLDENLHRSLLDVLEKLGFRVFDVRDCGLRGEPDEVVFEFAQRKKAVLFSSDMGFSNILRFPLGEHYGICILRFPNEMRTEDVNRELSRLLSRINIEDFEGSLVVVSPGKIRLRKVTGAKKYPKEIGDQEKEG